MKKTPVIRRCVALGIAAFALSTLAHAQASAFQLLSHRAVYDLSLAPGPAGNIVDVTGRMVLEWADACEGYTTQQRMLMRVLRNDGGDVESDFRVSAWESKNGETFRFDVRNIVAGGTPENFKGRADRTSSLAQAVFQSPSDLSLDLPKKIVFPSEHIARIIDGAQAGETRISVPLFDGTGEDGLFEAVGFVLGPADALAPEVTDLADGALKDVPAWNLRLSFFGLRTNDSLPVYEVSLRLFANGIADRLVLDYDDFAVAGRLTGLERVSSPSC